VCLFVTLASPTCAAVGAQSEELHKRVVGQNEAVNAVADAVLRGRAGERM